MEGVVLDEDYVNVAELFQWYPDFKANGFVSSIQEGHF
jgi:hypothetical protein